MKGWMETVARQRRTPKIVVRLVLCCHSYHIQKNTIVAIRSARLLGVVKVKNVKGTSGIKASTGNILSEWLVLEKEKKMISDAVISDSMGTSALSSNAIGRWVNEFRKMTSMYWPM